MSGINKGLSGFFGGQGPAAATAAQTDSEWRNPWPNTPDFTFNYGNLLRVASSDGFASAGKSATETIAIIGAGIAGLTVARELLRCGYRNLTLLESTSRIGGRNYSLASPNNKYTVYEMGAMRIPFFSGNSALSAYADEFGITTQNFPDPGAVMTGVFYNRGYGPGDANGVPKLNKWMTGHMDDLPPIYRNIYTKWQALQTAFRGRFKSLYEQGDAAFLPAWHGYADANGAKSFREFVVSPLGDENDAAYPAGMNLKDDEARVFSTIGAGDGSWGAFYALSAMYPIRTLLCGFGDQHQLVQGVFPRPHLMTEPPVDRRGKPFGNLSNADAQEHLPPAFLGVQSFAESLMFMPMKSADPGVNGKSPYDLLSRDSHDDGRLAFFTQCRVTGGSLQENGKVRLWRPYVESGEPYFDYSAVVDTTTSWSGEMSRGRSSSEENVFSSTKGFPAGVWSGYKSSHWITSCKVFLPLKQRYWEKADSPPQVIVSDTWLQDSYGYVSTPKGVSDNNDTGVLLVSYTWEDDALKLIADADQNDVLAQDAIGKLESMLKDTKEPSLADSVDLDHKSAVIHWTTLPDYRGCASLYHAGLEFENFEIVSYNEKFAVDTHYYFAGEAFSLFGGWTEPAVRHALDAVMHFLKNDNAQFRIKGFDFDADYPKYGANPYSADNPYAGDAPKE